MKQITEDMNDCKMSEDFETALALYDKIFEASDEFEKDKSLDEFNKFIGTHNFTPVEYLGFELFYSSGDTSSFTLRDGYKQAVEGVTEGDYILIDGRYKFVRR